MDINETFFLKLIQMWFEQTQPFIFWRHTYIDLLQILASSTKANGIFVITPDPHYFSSVLEYLNLGFLQLEVLADISRISFPNGAKGE